MYMCVHTSSRQGIRFARQQQQCRHLTRHGSKDTPSQISHIKNLSKLLIFQPQTFTRDNCLFCKHSGNMEQHIPKPGIILSWLLTICATMLIDSQAAAQENTEVSSAYRSESLLL